LIQPYTTHLYLNYMKIYAKYLIAASDQFDPLNYYKIEEEIDSINEKTSAFPEKFKPEMIVSFLKDHSMENNWASANSQLAEAITSGTLFSGDIESLFDSCRNNPGFRKGLENYLFERFGSKVVPAV
jgi:hypothetical protein